MSEIEVPLEQVQEGIQHAAHHGHGPDVGFMNRAALLSAFLAVVAAISALFAGHYANEAMIEQIQSSDQWAYYQAKGIKGSIMEMRNEANPSPALQEKIDNYKEDQKEIQVEAEHKAAESKHLLARHESLAASVTLFQVAIALTAIAVLTRRRRFLTASALLGAAGLLWTIKTFFV